MRFSPEIHVTFVFANIPYNHQIEYNRPRLTKYGMAAAMVAESFDDKENYESVPMNETAQQQYKNQQQ